MNNEPQDSQPDGANPELVPGQRSTGKMSATAKAALFVFVLVVGGVGGYFLVSSGNTAEDEVAYQQPNTDGATVTIPRSDTVASDYFESYTIENEEFGTRVTVTIDEGAGTRTIARNALPNHSTGTFPNDGNPNTISEQDFTDEYPLKPVYTGTAAFAQIVGIAINGVKLEPDTAERVTCETGEVHSIEAIQMLTNLGLDFNNAHVQPTGEYHYHGVSELLVDLYDTDQDLVHVAFAADGHMMYYSKSGAYTPSYRLGNGAREGSGCTYTQPGPSGGETIQISNEKDGSLKSDWDYDASYGDLDECNGIEIDGQYAYLITDDYPYIGRCLMGESSQAASQGPGGALPQGGAAGQNQVPPRR